MFSYLSHPFIIISRYFFCCFCYYLESKYLYIKLYKIRVILDIDNEDQNGILKKKKEEGIHLPPFGLATYKMQGDVWISGGSGEDQEKLVSLLHVAGSWLKQLNVQHHDFNYFLGYRHGWWLTFFQDSQQPYKREKWDPLLHSLWLLFSGWFCLLERIRVKILG